MISDSHEAKANRGQTAYHGIPAVGSAESATGIISAASSTSETTCARCPAVSIRTRAGAQLDLGLTPRAVLPHVREPHPIAVADRREHATVRPSLHPTDLEPVREIRAEKQLDGRGDRRGQKAAYSHPEVQAIGDQHRATHIERLLRRHLDIA
jgi:hypothetical protein